MARPISFEAAKARFPHRFTMEHVPAWALAPMPTGAHYAPQYRSDREWYDATLFHGESDLASRKHCFSAGQTWPLGECLNEPFRRA